MGAEVSFLGPGAKPEEIDGAFIPFPFIAYTGTVDGKLVGAGGLQWHHGRCWLWFDRFNPDVPINALAVVRWGRRMLRIAQRYGDEVVSAGRDDRELMSERLLTLLDFRRTGDMIAYQDGKEQELWEWRASAPSPQSSQSGAP